MPTAKSKIDVDAIRRDAFDKLATWMRRWDAVSGQDSTKEDILKDLITYSPTNFDEHHEAHDHEFLIFHPSVGDEAGTWTLYVTTNYNPYRGDEGVGGKDYITSMWQVFDTLPNPIYMLINDGGKEVWMHTPTDQGYDEEAK